jgi:hypothetical protein
MSPATAWGACATAASGAALRRAPAVPAFRRSPFDARADTPFARHSVVPARFRNHESLRALLEPAPSGRPQRRFSIGRFSLGLHRLLRIGMG